MNTPLQRCRLTREDVERLTAGMKRGAEAAPQPVRYPTNRGTTKFPREVILRVRDMKEAGRPHREIAEETGVRQQSINWVYKLSEGMA